MPRSDGSCATSKGALQARKRAKKAKILCGMNRPVEVRIKGIMNDRLLEGYLGGDIASLGTMPVKTVILSETAGTCELSIGPECFKRLSVRHNPDEPA
jgi:hypothetical protein